MCRRDPQNTWQSKLANQKLPEEFKGVEIDPSPLMGKHSNPGPRPAMPGGEMPRSYAPVL